MPPTLKQIKALVNIGRAEAAAGRAGLSSVAKKLSGARIAAAERAGAIKSSQAVAAAARAREIAAYEKEQLRRGTSPSMVGGAYPMSPYTPAKRKAQLASGIPEFADRRAGFGGAYPAATQANARTKAATRGATVRMPPITNAEASANLRSGKRADLVVGRTATGRYPGDGPTQSGVVAEKIPSGYDRSLQEQRLGVQQASRGNPGLDRAQRAADAEHAAYLRNKGKRK